MFVRMTNDFSTNPAGLGRRRVRVQTLFAVSGVLFAAAVAFSVPTNATIAAVCAVVGGLVLVAGAAAYLWNALADVSTPDGPIDRS